MTTNVAAASLRRIPIANSLPSPKPQALAVTLDFTADTIFNVDLTLPIQQGIIDQIQTVFIDNSANAAAVTLQVNSPSNQKIMVGPSQQGFFSVLVPNNAAVFTITSTAGTGSTIVNFINVEISQNGGGGGTTSGNFQFDGSGNLLTHDSLLDALISGGTLLVKDNTVNGTLTGVISGGKVQTSSAPSSGAPTDRSTVTVAATSTQLCASNANRKNILIKSPETADVWINLAGGTAGINLAGCIKLVAGGQIYESGSFVTTAQINYYCATGTLQLNALEA